MKMMKQTEPEAEEHRLCLNENEYNKLTEDFFQVQSIVRLVGENCSEIGGGVQDFEDIANCLKLAEEKLNIMATLIMK